MLGPLPRRSHGVRIPVSSSVSSAFPQRGLGRLPASLREYDFSRGVFSRLQTFSLCSGLRVCLSPRSFLPLLKVPQGSRDFYIRAERASLPAHAPDMLAVRIQAIDGTRTSTLLDSQPCRPLPSPSPQAAQPASHEVPVDRQGDHRWGFPCCYWATLPTCRRHYPGRSDRTRSLLLFHQRRPAHITRGEGSCVNRFEACSAFTSRYGLHARQVTYVTLYTGGSAGFVSSTAAPIASGWSEPSSRAGLSPAVDQRFSRRTRNRD